MAAFALEVLHVDGSVVVQLLGELDVAGLPALVALRSLSSRYDAEQVVLDCTGLSFIDVAGLGEVLSVVRRFGPSGRPVLRNPSATLCKVLALTGTTDVFAIELDLDSPDPARSLPQV